MDGLIFGHRIDVLIPCVGVIMWVIVALWKEGFWK